MNEYIITYDIGTTSLKTCLFKSEKNPELIASASDSYPIDVLENGGVEQNPDHWWKAVCLTTRRIITDNKIKSSDIKGVSLCAQMQGLVLVDDEGRHIRNSMSYMDNRGESQMKKTVGKGPAVDGFNVFKLLKSIRITGVAATSAKDPIYRYLWVKENEPELFEKTSKWLDVKEYIIARSTGNMVMTEDSAFATLLMDIRKNKRIFSPAVCSIYGVDINHLPDIIKSTDTAGYVTAQAAAETGLAEGTPVFGGGGDASLLGVGAGAVNVGDTHIYMGTSGWVSTVVDKPKLDLIHKIGSIVGADDVTFNYFAELETAGKCIEWVKDHLSYEETIDYLNSSDELEYEEITTDLYEYMMDSISKVPPGSNGVMFTPWLHGSRCPFEDSHARGMFFNIGLETGKRELIHAVLEGVCYHLRWQLESIEKKFDVIDGIKLVGGGALAPGTCQLLADIIGRKIIVVKNPQNAGAVGAVLIAAVGLGIMDNLHDAGKLIEIDCEYIPDMKNKEIHDRQFKLFKSLYYNNKAAFHALNN